MCGICGVVQIGGPPRPVVSRETIDRMTDAMTHRGPNDRGVVQRDGMAFGARRLSIVDVEAGHQPFTDESGEIVGMQNGELYNHEQIRRDLTAAGHVLHTRCDTEILPHLYERDGDKVPERLVGKFAIAVWDGRRRRCVVARDRLGVKPLYWTRVGDLVLFASELKSLLASGMVATGLDYEAVDAYLAFGFFSGPRTPLAGVHKLMPGHRLVVDEHGPRTEAYWSYPRPQAREGLSDAEWQELLLGEMESAVVSRLMSDVPLGAMLSGGLDSSVIVALMARNMREPVKTFSVGFVEDGDGNELGDAKLVSEALGTDHHALELSIHDPSLDLDTLVHQMDEPLADLSSLGFTALSQLAAQHVTVALSGQGADELLGGYNKHRAAAALRPLPRPARAALRGIAPHAPARIGRIANTAAADGPVDRLLAMSAMVDPELRRRLVRGPLAELDGHAARRVIALRAGDVTDDPLPATLYIDAQLALVDDMLHYFDRASMAHSLEVRVPFLDHRLVELCATIPGGLKVRRGTTKHVFKEAARGLIPDRIIDKPKLGFFAGSIDRWFTAQAETAIPRYLLAPEPRYAEFLDRATVEQLVRGHTGGSDTRHGRLLLALLLLEAWLTSVLPWASPAPPAVPEVEAQLAEPDGDREPALTYAVVTPARNEVENLARLAASLAAQTSPPARWVVVDNGSDDATPQLLAELAAEHPWIHVVDAPEIAAGQRGGPIVRAFEKGYANLGIAADVVVKVDADVSFESDYFVRLLDAFAADERLGMASGTAHELDDGRWLPRFNTGSSVWGAARAYRAACLEGVLPLERHMGWDGIDERKAALRGWTTRTIDGLPFRHHRAEGERDGSPWRAWTARGRASHYMGYRAWYLALRSLHHARREPAALGMVWGYGMALARRGPVCSDPEVRAELRRAQSLRALRTRRTEAVGASGRP
jgi:asparagine synthase (glutamine-hydrolysing)